MFQMKISGADFLENRLKIVSMATLHIAVKDQENNVLESFTTQMGQTDYSIQTPLKTEHIVEINVAPGEQIEFYPVVHAI